MTTFDPLLRPSASGEEAIPLVYRDIYNWIDSEMFQSLIKEFSISDSFDKDIDIRLEHLVEQSDVWDFRNRTAKTENSGGSTQESTRWTSTDELLTAKQKRKSLEAAKYFKLSINSTPNYHDYRAVLVLGGGKLSCQLRTRYALEQLTSNISAHDLVFLGSERPITPTEREATDTYAKGAETEFDLFESALIFETKGETTKISEDIVDEVKTNSSFKTKIYTTKYAKNTILISAPSSEPDIRRANSSDTYIHYFKKYPINAGDKLLLVTSHIYVPYQQVEALRTLGVPNNVYVETIGFPPSWGGKIQGMQEPQHYLQEIRSFLQAAHRFTIQNSPKNN